MAIKKLPVQCQRKYYITAFTKEALDVHCIFYQPKTNALNINRSSCLEAFCKNGALINLAKFTGKHFCQSLFFNEVAS